VTVRFDDAVTYLAKSILCLTKCNSKVIVDYYYLSTITITITITFKMRFTITIIIIITVKNVIVSITITVTPGLSWTKRVQSNSLNQQ